MRDENPTTFPPETQPKAGEAVATFAAGCFWGVEASFQEIAGVVDVQAGYTGGHAERPSYEEVCTGATGHAEAVRVVYDGAKTGFKDLLDHFFHRHAPPAADRVRHDGKRGPDAQYRHAVFVHDAEQAREARFSLEVAEAAAGHALGVEIVEAGTWWPAEERHQNFMAKRTERERA
jgi:peptide-methionine (S)-S-oxide reductase